MKRFFIILIIFLAVIAGGTLAFGYFKSGTFTFLRGSSATSSVASATSTDSASDSASSTTPAGPLVTHLATPDPVKALYVSSWVAGSPKPYQHILDLLDTTEANAVVIDIKDATGRVSFADNDSIVADTKSPQIRIKDINALINDLHARGVYVIGRISTFQDPYLAGIHPDWAISKKSDGTTWKDTKGLSYLDPANQNVWDYTVALAKDSYAVGFDEINFDYVRYPSDGDIKNINYRLVDGATRADNIEKFFAYLDQQLHAVPGMKISADLFGMTTTEKTDMGIGQVLEKALPYFDYVAPMVYPSHYADFIGYSAKDVAKHPYEVVLAALKGAKEKIAVMRGETGTTSATSAVSSTGSATGSIPAPIDPNILAKVHFAQIRPWLQDFSINGVTYTADMVRDQMQATYDAGLTSWMMWDPSNKYTTAAYEKQP